MSEIKDKAQAQKLFSLTEKQQVPAKKDPRKLEAAKMFEGQFIRQMITEMRKTTSGDALVPESMGERIFKGQLDDKYADQWVENGGIGLSNIIYDQLDQRYGGKKIQPAKAFPSEVMDIKQTQQEEITGNLPAPVKQKKTSDIFSERDKDLFLLKKTNTGFHIKSREPLPEHVDIKSPVSATVFQAAALGEGKQMVILGHDEGLNLQFVHTGKNIVRPGDIIKAGQTIAQLPSSRQGEVAEVFFGLRKRPLVE